jgi:hypothetical protein
MDNTDMNWWTIRYYAITCPICGRTSRVPVSSESSSIRDIRRCIHCGEYILLIRTVEALSKRQMECGLPDMVATYLRHLIDNDSKDTAEGLASAVVLGRVPYTLKMDGSSKEDEKEQKRQKHRPISQDDLNMFRQQVKGLDYPDYFRKHISGE